MAALAVAAIAAPAAQAKPAPLTRVSCGDQITRSIRVANDLRGCIRGLTAESSDITIDLNGHTFTGQGADVSGSGVSLSHVDRVTVRNGTLRDFREGVSGDVTADVTVSRVRAIDNLNGYRFSESQRLLLADSSAAGGQAGARIGLLTYLSRVTRFRASRNARAGIEVVTLSGSNVVERSQVDGSDIGIRVNEADANTITRNRVSGARVGILVQVYAHGNRILDNDVTRSRETGIGVVDGTPDLSRDNVLRGNRVTRSGADGILVAEDAPGTVVARNQAFHNALLGINAAAVAVDGGGNRAHRNGDARQCVGVACRR